LYYQWECKLIQPLWRTVWRLLKKNLGIKSLQIINARECGENGTFLHCWWEFKLVQGLWRTVWRFLKKLKIVILLGIHQKKNVV